MPLLPQPGYTLRANRAVHFTFHDPQAQTVRLVADFTHWTVSPLALKRGNTAGSWEVDTAPLPEGVHFYKYIVDGRWTHDPSHPMVEYDGCGGWNSVFGLGGPSLGGPEALRVVSLNLHTYQEPHALLKLEQAAYAVAAMDIDVLALQEVGQHVSDPGQPNAGEWLRERLELLSGERWYHVWRMAHVGFGAYYEGVSLLARAPLQDAREYRLSEGPLARNAVAATLELKGMRLRLCNPHISWPLQGGETEVLRLLAGLEAEGPAGHDAILLAGDFNGLTHDPQVHQVRAAGYIDVASVAAVDGRAFPTAMLQRWERADGSSFGDDKRSRSRLMSRIDYHFLRSQVVRPLSCIPVFNGWVVGDVYQPFVSDHIGILGLYVPDRRG